MADSEDDVLFRIGFAEHPETFSRLDSLAKAVEATQERMTKSVSMISAKVLAEAESIQRMTTRAMAETSVGMSRQPANQSAGVAASHSRLASEMGITADQVKKLIAEGRLTDKGGASGGVNGDMVAISRKEVEEIMRDDQRMRADLDAGRQQQEASAKSYTDQMTALSEARRIQMETEAAAMQAGSAQIAKDLDLVNRAQQSGGAANIGVTEVDVAQAKERIAQVLQAHEEAEKSITESTKTEAKNREQLHKQQQALDRDMATPFIVEYAKEERAAAAAMQSIAASRRQLVESFTSSGEAIGKVLRGVALLGVAEGRDLQEAMKTLAKVQAGIDLATGGAQLLRNMAKGMDALRGITIATTAAKQAEAAQATIATAASAKLAAALELEALSAANAARAHAMLSVARSGKGAAGVATAAAGAGAAQVAGRAVGGAAAAGGAATSAGVGAGATATSLGILAAAGVAAAAGLAFAGKSAYEMGKEAKEVGIAGGARKGSFSDTVGGSKWNPISALVAWSARAELAQKEEQSKRMTAMSETFKLQKEHERSMMKLEGDSARERIKIRKDREFGNRIEDIDRMRDPTQKAAASDSVLRDLRNSLTVRQMDARRFETTDNNTGESKIDIDDPKAAAAVAEVEDAYNRLNDALESRQQIEREVQAETKRSTMEQIAGIESVIKTRLSEKKQLEDSFKSAKERFGEMTALEQTLAIKALDKARTGTATKKDIDRLGNVDTIESKRLVSEFRTKQADKAGFDNKFGRDDLAQINDKNAAINKGIDELAGIAGKSGSKQTRESIEANARNSASLEIVDKTQIEVGLNIQEDRMIDNLVAEIRKFQAGMDKRLEEAIKRQLKSDQAAETESFGGKVQAASAAAG